jgi:hypothetical protein
MHTEITVITANDTVDPRKLIILPHFMASRAAMKNVLSPISHAKIRLKAAKKPDFASTDVVSSS